MVTLQRLECFVQVAECLNFSEAAQRLHITQPSLSRQIGSLEQELGIQLFERNTRKVALTPAGRALADEAREVLRRSSNLHVLARRLSDGYAGKVNVGYASSIDACVIARFLSANKVYQPRLDVSLHRMNQGRLITSLKSGGLDAAFLFRNGVVEKSGLNMIHVDQSRLCVVVPRNHPLAGRESVSIGELDGLTLNLMDRGESAAAHDQLLALCQRHGLVPDGIQSCDEPQVILLNVVAGKGVAVLPITEKDRLIFDLDAIPLTGDNGIVAEDVVVAYDSEFQNDTTAVFLGWVRKFAGRSREEQSE